MIYSWPRTRFLCNTSFRASIEIAQLQNLRVGLGYSRQKESPHAHLANRRSRPLGPACQSPYFGI